jgi:hypothetical protein
LRSHPHDLVRLTFIRDTLEHCPYENLKASAVSWLKGETLEANSSQAQSQGDDGETNIFATPVALSTVAPFLWPDLTSHYTSLDTDIAEAWIQFRQEFGFYVAALNFYYLLLEAPRLHDTLGIKQLQLEQYVEPLKNVAKRFQLELEAGGEKLDLEGEGLEQAKADVGLLQKVIEWVEGPRKKV